MITAPIRAWDVTRNQEIEVLRGVAILLVVVSHLGFLFWWRIYPWYAWICERYTFWIGVDLFFCISGFVIARTVVPKLRAKNGPQFWAEVVAFWIRRWYRIIPSAWLWVAIILVPALALRGSGVFVNFQSSFPLALSSLLNVANVHVFDCLARNRELCEGNPLTIYWSLSLEEQFYLLLPIACLATRRKLVAVSVFGVALQFFLDRSSSSSLLWFFRTDAILIGVLLALAWESRTLAVFEPRGLTRPALRWGLLLLLLTSLGAVPAMRVVPFTIGFVAVVSGLLVFAAGFDRGYLMAPSPLRTLLAYVGSRSYAIYLVHWPAFLLAREIWTRTVGAVTPETELLAVWFHSVVGLGLACGLAELNFRLIEKPFRARGRAVATAYLARHQAIVEPVAAVASDRAA